MADPVNYTSAIKTAGGLIGAASLGGGAVGASIGDGLAGSQTIAGVAASPRPRAPADHHVPDRRPLRSGLLHQPGFAALFVFSLGK